MSVHTPSSVGWSAFDRWEGPVVWGKHPFRVPQSPSWTEKLVAIIAATEGNYDSVNMYDRAICSVGVIQFTELTGLNVSNMLGVVAERAPHAMAFLEKAMDQSEVVFDRKPSGDWRFRRGTMWFDTPDQMRHLFLGGAGLRHTWSPERKEHARLWCASIANVFTSTEAQLAQVQFTVPRLETFGLAPARRILWDGSAPDNGGMQGAMRAAFLSYAVNLPVVASRCVVNLETKAPKWSLDWAVDLLRSFVVSSQIAIWPDRYNRIRPRLESLFSVNLPDFAKDLRGDSDGLGSIHGLQTALSKLGFDPGPIDGVWGKKSEAAVREYQRARGLEVDGHVGPKTRARLQFDLDANIA